MKADKTGGPTDQFAARIGYLQPSERRKAALPANRTCSTCDKSTRAYYTTAWGGCGVSLLCVHPGSPGEKGVTTKDNAVCDCWNRRLS